MQARDMRDDLDDSMADDGATIVRSEPGALEAITRSEVAMQLDAAHRWPRSPTRFLRDAVSLATYTREIAESCMYSIPRGGKMITGPSVRLAEICASTYGNMHVAARVLDDTQRSNVVAQAVAWDLERNLRITVEAQRGILTSRGKRYDDDMVRVTGMAAISIALRNAIFRVIPRAYIEPIYDRARATAVGDVQTLSARRDEWLARLGKLGVTPDRVFYRLGVVGVSDVTLEHIATLIGITNAIKQNEIQIDDAFPRVPIPSIGGGPAPVIAPAAAALATAPTVPPFEAVEGRRVRMPGKRGAAASAVIAPAVGPVGAPPPAAAPPAAPPAAPAPSPAAAAPVDLSVLLALLVRLDDAWTAPDAVAILATWTEAERGEALAWARAVLEDGPFAAQLRRPAFTNIDGPDEAAP